MLRKLRQSESDAADGVFGYIEDVEDYAEGKCWCTSAAGSRVSASIRGARYDRRHYWTSKPGVAPEVWWRQPYIRLRFEGLCRGKHEAGTRLLLSSMDGLCREEHEAVEQLVQAKTQEGLVNIEPLRMDP